MTRQNTDYDLLIVGSGLFGATVAQRAAEAGKKCLVLERRGHIAGNAYTENIEGIQLHVYGPHIFHTNNEEVWQYVNRFAKFNNFVNSPLANFKGKLYNLPFNMHTFNQMWGVTTPQEAQERIEQDRRAEFVENPQNLEQMAVNLVGREIFETLIRGYTEKQWGRKCSDLPASIIKRLPIRFTFDNNYYNAKYQGIPVDGYTTMVQNMLDGIEVLTDTDYLAEKARYDKLARHIIFTGPIDEYFGYRYGALEYRSVYFENETLDTANYQGVAVVNYTDNETPFIRVIEHKHFERNNQPNQLKTIISREFSREWTAGIEPYYPIESAANTALYNCYAALARHEKKVTFGGRLGAYRYYDMDKVIELALTCAANLKVSNDVAT